MQPGQSTLYDEAYFKNQINHFYQEVDRGFRTLGCEALGSQDIFYRLSRVATPVVEYSEIKRILADVDAPSLGPEEPSGHRRWPLAWGRAAARYKAVAEEAESRGHRVTAGNNYLRASLLAHSGQLFCRPEWPEKNHLRKERVACYKLAAACLRIEALSIPYQGEHLPAYLWLPDGNSKPPLVIMCPGANSVKEELHRWAAPLRERGLATLRFEGPGQGEMSPGFGGRLPLRFESFHEVFTAVIDHACRELAGRVDTSRIALWGQATGGNLVTRACRYEKRPVAIVNLAGQPDMSAYPFLSGDVQEENKEALGFSTYMETWNYLQEHANALPDAEHVDVPCLILHGSRGELAANQAMQNLAAAIGKNAELVIYPDGNHGIFNWDFLMTDRMADWLLDRLTPPPLDRGSQNR